MNTRLLSFAFLATAVTASAQSPSRQNAPETSPAQAPAASQAVVLDPVVVTGALDQARESILPNLGATSFYIDEKQIENQPQGEDAPFNQVLLRAPGVAQDSAANGDLHVRGEHANLQYRINDVLLPEGISGFGLELDPRFVSSLQLITGSLPAQYGFRTAGIVDVKTKNGAFDPGGNASFHTGSYDTVHPSFESAGTSEGLSYFADGSYEHNSLGIENPTIGSTAIHDATEQYRAFAYIERILDATSRLSAMASASYSDFQIPNTPGQPPGTAPNGAPWLPGTFDSSLLDENQNEQNYYGVVSYQKSAGDLNLQSSVFGRESSVRFMPDTTGDLYFNGASSYVERGIDSGGAQADGSYDLADTHTLRGGLFFLDEKASTRTRTSVFPVDGDGNPTGPAFAIVDDPSVRAVFLGSYLQDEWKLGSALTLNCGLRFDVFNSSFDNENQLSPRINLIWQPTTRTTLHAGYARYFTPPPAENVTAGTVEKFDNTSIAGGTTLDDPVRAERADYFDAGISQRLAQGWQAGLDGYYKRAKDQLDDGLFGQTLILSAFNYAEGEVYGLEFTTSYAKGGFSAYANLASSVAKGRNLVSAEFLFDPDDLTYIRNHWIHLDHDQALTGSLGAAQLWKESGGSTRLYADLIYGTGLRTSTTAPDGSDVPNGGTVPSYGTISLGAEQTFRLDPRHSVKVRIDVVNVADDPYELRDGSGIGVNAAQFGPRRSIFGTIIYVF